MDFDHISRTAAIQKRFFCQTAISVEYILAAVSVFCIVCESEIPSLSVFSNIFICIHPTITNVIIPRRRSMILRGDVISPWISVT